MTEEKVTYEELEKELAKFLKFCEEYEEKGPS